MGVHARGHVTSGALAVLLADNEAMTAKHGKLTRAQRLAILDRQRELERRAAVGGGVTSKMVELSADPDYDAEASKLPHARPAPPRPAVIAETRRAAAKADELAAAAAAIRRSRLTAIASGVMPGTEAWARWERRRRT